MSEHEPVVGVTKQELEEWIGDRRISRPGDVRRAHNAFTPRGTL